MESSSISQLAQMTAPQAKILDLGHNATFPGDRNQGLQVGISSGTINNTFNIESATKITPNYQLGLRLGEAPQIGDDHFVGREAELEQLEQWLSPKTTKQNIVAVSGLGGMGKTQLSIHFAKHHHKSYSSVMWFNANNAATLTTGYVQLALWLIGQEERRSEKNQPDEDQAVRYVRQWLSQPENDQWLVIYDNYDDPQMPGIKSSTGYDIRQFFPERTQGSVLITTRFSGLTFANPLPLLKFEDIDQSLTILANWSGRSTEKDPGARKLANRLAGLPLALTTAGSYLRKTTDSFSDYLQIYQENWDDLADNSNELLEYADRTFYSTWNLSLKQVQDQDPGAANLLRLMAYLSNQDLWYELFQEGAESGPAWLKDVVKNKPRFNRAMTKLQEYSLVEVGAGTYSLHTCVHDWTLEYLNRGFDAEFCLLAMHCIGQNVGHHGNDVDFWKLARRLGQHVSRLEHGRLEGLIDWSGVDVMDLYHLGYLHYCNLQDVAAERKFQLSLKGHEERLNSNDLGTLNAAGMLGAVYQRLGKLPEAVMMYERALRGYTVVVNSSHISTLKLDIFNILVNVSPDQDKTNKVEILYQHLFEESQKTQDISQATTSILILLRQLGTVYSAQGKKNEAEIMLKRALRGYEKILGAGKIHTLYALFDLGLFYWAQDKLVDAEKIIGRTLKGIKRQGGAEHPDALYSLYNLGKIYWDQGKLMKAKTAFQQALEGYSKAYGPDHEKTMDAATNLRLVNEDMKRNGVGVVRVSKQGSGDEEETESQEDSESGEESEDEGDNEDCGGDQESGDEKKGGSKGVRTRTSRRSIFMHFKSKLPWRAR